MAHDFSFCGINIGQYGVHYAPETPSWHIWGSAFETIEKTVDSQHGGQWYGYVIRPKQFALRCYFEEITEYQLAVILGMFAEGKFGELVFDERPWLAYEARVTRPYEINKYPTVNRNYSGTIMLYLTAYYPFATTNIQTLDDAVTQYPDKEGAIKATTGLMAADTLATETPATTAAPYTIARTILRINAGDAIADTIIRIAGNVGNGVTLYNQATKQYCFIHDLTETETTSSNRWLELNSRTGECYITDGANRFSGYKYHDRGFIQLAPSAPMKRDVTVSINGTSLTSTEDIFMPDDIGKTIWVPSASMMSYISDVSGPRSASLALPASTAVTAPVNIAMLNNIHITPKTDMSLTKFELIHKHTFK